MPCIAIGGSKGGRQGRAPPWGIKFFHFYAVFGKKLKNNSTFGSWRPPPPGENPGSATDCHRYLRCMAAASQLLAVQAIPVNAVKGRGDSRLLYRDISYCRTRCWRSIDRRPRGTCCVWPGKFTPPSA